jgi:hypothetical protein
MLSINKFFVLLLVLSASPVCQAGWMDFLQKKPGEAAGESGTELAKSALSNNEVVTGLKEALATGVESAINTLGKPGGFSSNPLVKIAVPDSLKTVASAARTMGQGQYVDDIEITMNKAAEQAVPEAASILADAIRKMSIDDAMTILNGPDDAATQYFRKVAGKSLAERFKPIVSQATDATGATASYKQLMGTANSMLGGFLKNNNSLDLDQYVTNKALDGLFQYIAKEEQAIRHNPAARSSEILRKVFSNQ